MHNRNSFRPQLLSLDNRCVPSATVTVIGTDMTIHADDLGGLIQIRDDGKGNITVNVPNDKTPLAKAYNISQIAVLGGAGNDVIDFRTTGTLKHALDFETDLGAGNDRVSIDLYRGIVGAPVNLDLNTGAGNDSTLIQFGVINNSQVDVHEALGAGNDNASLVMFNGLSGHSQMNIDVAGESGADRVDLNMMGKIDATAAVNARVANVDGSNDRLLVRYRGELDGSVNVRTDHAASQYGIQGWFALDAASMGTFTTSIIDDSGAVGSSLTVTDHTGGPKISVLDRLDNTLTSPPGTKVTYFTPM
jgi:hypothetical protein